MIRVFIVHESQAMRAQVSAVLQGETDIEIVGCVGTVDEALQQMAKSPCDVVLASFALPDNDTLRLIQAAGEEPGSFKVLVTGIEKSTDVILHCIEEGAAGYVCAQESWADLVKKIRAVDEDEFLMCPDIAPAIMARIAELKQLVAELDAGSVTQSNNYYAELTQREWEVLRFIGQTMSNQEIAEALTIELGTVKNHVHNLLRKLDVCSRKQAAQLARQIFGDRYLETGVGAAATPQGSTWNGQRLALHAGAIAHG
jgi:DNA-binding NarL/FixJ family response regulator